MRGQPHYRNANHTGILRMAGYGPFYNGRRPDRAGTGLNASPPSGPCLRAAAGLHRSRRAVPLHGRDLHAALGGSGGRRTHRNPRPKRPANHGLSRGRGVRTRHTPRADLAPPDQRDDRRPRTPTSGTTPASTSRAWRAPSTRTSPSGRTAASSRAPAAAPSRSSWRRTSTSTRRSAPSAAPSASSRRRSSPSS